MRRRALVLAVAVAVAAAGGCNAILGNEPGRLDGDDDADDAAAARGRGRSSQEPGGDAGVSHVVGPAEDEGARDAAGSDCGRCGLPNATATCLAGECGIVACDDGFSDCNGAPDDGCETDLTAVTSCGGCGVVCPVLEHVTVTCVAGACAGACEPGFGDCNGDPDDGCEKNLRKDRKNCGRCGARCPIGRCDDGSCVWP